LTKRIAHLSNRKRQGDDQAGDDDEAFRILREERLDAWFLPG
jgi:hypothetical protein